VIAMSKVSPLLIAVVALRDATETVGIDEGVAPSLSLPPPPQAETNAQNAMTVTALNFMLFLL